MNKLPLKNKSQTGFTLIELIIVIVILGVLSVVAAPRFIDISSDARVSALNGIAGQVKSMVKMVQAKAAISGMRASDTNPGAAQTELIIDLGYGQTELMYSNLCPESSAEHGDALDMLDFLDVSFNDSIDTRVDNQYTLVGFDLPASGVPLDQGCYLIYDSFAVPNCTVEIVDVDC